MLVTIRTLDLHNAYVSGELVGDLSIIPRYSNYAIYSTMLNGNFVPNRGEIYNKFYPCSSGTLQTHISLSNLNSDCFIKITKEQFDNLLKNKIIKIFSVFNFIFD